MRERATIIVKGLVQGVFFRTSAQNKARELGITGSIKNYEDGSVQIIAEGEREGLEEFIEWTRSGSDLASVEDVVVGWGDALGVFNDFEISY